MFRRIYVFLPLAFAVACADSQFSGIGSSGETLSGKDSKDSQGSSSYQTGPGADANGATIEPGSAEILVDPGCVPEDTINFEDLSENNIDLKDQYKLSHGVSFQLSNGKYPRLATVGMSPIWHECKGGTGGKCSSPTNGIRTESRDIAGSKFLGARLTSSLELIVRYENPVPSASGYIIDIDGDEYFEISAYDSAGLLLAKNVELDSRNKSTNYRDGQATFFAVSVGEPRITKIVIHGQRPFYSANISFDRFSPGKVCR